jgi:hypothetical protein
MARIEKLKVGDTVVEMLGAHTDRNYFSSHLPELHVQMFGAGSVQYQINEDWMFRGERSNSPSGQVPINMERVPDPAGWGNVGGVIAAGAAVTIILAAYTEINFIRAIIVTTGDGYLATATHWD